jgi:Type II secretion system (T2SS), protein E, N-terminal domain
MSEFRPIIMRSNRLLGAALVERNLITVEQLEAATERLLQVLDQGIDRDACLLRILIIETKALREELFLEHLVEEMSMGLLDMREIDLHDDLKSQLNFGMCWATWTIPFDKDDDIHYVASAYYLSPAVRQHWEKQLGTPIVWYATTIDSVADFLDKFEAERNGGAAAKNVAAVA